MFLLWGSRKALFLNKKTSGKNSRILKGSKLVPIFLTNKKKLFPKQESILTLLEGFPFSKKNLLEKERYFSQLEKIPLFSLTLKISGTHPWEIELWRIQPSDNFKSHFWKLQISKFSNLSSLFSLEISISITEKFQFEAIF